MQKGNCYLGRNAVRGMVYKALNIYRNHTNGTKNGEPLDDYSLQVVSPEEAVRYYQSL
ncbi:MAG: hypothetical protein AB7H97_09840 [Pseudobdellovibrionaceae bacterium]